MISSKAKHWWYPRKHTYKLVFKRSLFILGSSSTATFSELQDTQKYMLKA